MQIPLHPERASLHNEVHARPPVALDAPLSIAHFVMLADASGRQRSREHLALLLRDHHVTPPDDHSTHVRVDLGSFRLRWELHTEFVTWTFTANTGAEHPSTGTPCSASQAIPQDWLARMPGHCLSSLDLWVVSGSRPADDSLSHRALRNDSLVGSSVAAGQAEVLTDFAIHPHGSSRFLLYAGSLTSRSLGRLVQQLLEIETYRMAAMLGLPTARLTGTALATAESDLAELAQAIRSAERHEEARLLDRLTRLAAQVESQYATTHSRFSASSAYFELMDQRISDIGEAPLQGLQTIGEFIDRRLTPARKTCEWAIRRQDALSTRVSRVSSLLRTRVEIEQQQSSQDLLEALNRRQDLQLKLQATVEGLSVAAITYYIVGLVSYMAKGGQRLGWPMSAESTAALAIPLVATTVWWSLRRLHKSMFSH